MKYLVTVGGREIEVEVDGDKITVAGVTRTATLRSDVYRRLCLP